MLNIIALIATICGIMIALLAYDPLLCLICCLFALINIPYVVRWIKDILKEFKER